MCDLMVFIWSSVRGGSAVVESQSDAGGKGWALTAETLENFLNGSVLCDCGSGYTILPRLIKLYT